VAATRPDATGEKARKAAWFERPLGDWHEFIMSASLMMQKSPDEFVYRGQARAEWSLAPSLIRGPLRGATPEKTIEVERLALYQFQMQAHLHMPAALLPEDDDFLDWWALMQHYGAPTRLLDWTLSPYVAAYFAVAEHWDADGAVWCCHVTCMDTPARPTDLVNPSAAAKTFLYGREKLSDRMVAQQGVFTCSTRVMSDHRDAIRASRALEPSRIKFVIGSQDKPTHLRQLRAMNVTANSLFPGVDGLGRSVSEFVRLAATQPQRMVIMPH